MKNGSFFSEEVVGGKRRGHWVHTEKVTDNGLVITDTQ